MCGPLTTFLSVNVHTIPRRAPDFLAVNYLASCSSWSAVGGLAAVSPGSQCLRISGDVAFSPAAKGFLRLIERHHGRRKKAELPAIASCPMSAVAEDGLPKAQ